MTRTRTHVFRLASALAAILLAACAPKLYTVNLSPPFKEGQKFSLVSDITERSASHVFIRLPGVSAPQRDERNEEFIGRLEGDCEVLGVYPNGGIQKLAVTVTKLSASRSGKAVSNLPAAGAKIIVARQGDKIAISIDGQPAAGPTSGADGKPVNDPATDALNELILLDDEKSTIQELFGPKTPVKVGATWIADPTAVQNALSSGLGGKIAGAQGTMKLDSVKDLQGVPEATISGNLETTEYKPGMPAPMQVDSGNISGTMSWTVPVGAAKGVLKYERRVTMNIKAHGTPNDVSLNLEIGGQQIRTMQITLQ